MWGRPARRKEAETISKASAINKKKVGRWNKRVNMDGWIFCLADELLYVTYSDLPHLNLNFVNKLS